MFLLIAGIVLPSALAHTDQGGPGTPDLTCQTPLEWRVHDYAFASGVPPGPFLDGNREVCAPYAPQQVPACRRVPPGTPAWNLFCNEISSRFDGDYEFGVAGARLAVESGDGLTHGAGICHGMVGHHTSHVEVEDALFGTDVAFAVLADASLPGTVPPGEPDCGDAVFRPCGPTQSGAGPEVDTLIALLSAGICNPEDHLLECHGACDVPFAPGADGTYAVWVHPSSGGGPGGSATASSHGHVTS
jgi:hypothetical protein